MGRREALACCLAISGCFSEPETVGESSSGDGSSDSTGEAEDTVAISGVVNVYDGQELLAPLENALVSTSENPDLTSVTASDGAFRLEGVSVDAVWHLRVNPTLTHYGAIIGVEVRFGDLQDIEITLLRRDTVSDVIGLLQTDDASVDFDERRGTIIAVASAPGSSILLDPLPQPTDYFSFSFLGVPVSGNSVPVNPILPAVVFMNLQIGQPGGYVVSGLRPTGGDCFVPLDDPPLLPEHLSYVGLDCG